MPSPSADSVAVAAGTTIRRSRASRLIARATGCVNPLLRGRAQPDQLGLVQRALVGDDPRHVQSARRQGAGLVEDDRVDPRETLERPRPLDEDAFARRAPQRGQDGGRDSHARRGAVVGDQDRRRRVEAPREGAAQAGQGQGAPDFAIGQPLGEELDVRLLRRGGLDGADDPAHGGVGSEPLRADLDLAVLERRGREDAVAREALDRQRFAGHRLLIHHRLAADDRAVDGDALPRRDDDDVPGVEHPEVDRLAMVAGSAQRRSVRARPTTSLSDVRALTMLRATTSSPSARTHVRSAAEVKFRRAISSPSVEASSTSPFSRRRVASVTPARKSAGALDASRRPAVSAVRHRQAARGDEHRRRADYLEHRRRREAPGAVPAWGVPASSATARPAPRSSGRAGRRSRPRRDDTGRSRCAGCPSAAGCVRRERRAPPSARTRAPASAARASGRGSGCAGAHGPSGRWCVACAPYCSRVGRL